jgi:hypothetical protein
VVAAVAEVVVPVVAAGVSAVVADVAVVVADVTAEVAAVAVEGAAGVADVVAAEVVVPEPVVAAEVAGVAGVAVEVAGVTAEVAGVTVGVAVEVAAGVADVVAAEVAGVVVAEVVVPEPVVAAEVADVAVEVADVAVEVADATAEVAAEVTEVTVPEPMAGTVAARACRENASKTTRMPAAVIATCTARRAMCRKIGCGMSSSPPRTGQTRLPVPSSSGPKHAGIRYFRPMPLWSSEAGHGRSVRKCTYCPVITVQRRLRLRQDPPGDGRTHPRTPSPGNPR